MIGILYIFCKFSMFLYCNPYMLMCEVIKAIRTDLIWLPYCGFVCCVAGVQVWSVLSLYCTGGDHHKAQTGGAIWLSLRPSLGAWKAKTGGGSGAPL